MSMSVMRQIWRNVTVMSRSLLGGRKHQIMHANVDIELNGVLYTDSNGKNNVLLQTKESYLRDQMKPETAQLSKLEFTKNILEEVHRKQQEELALAVIGLSDPYELTKIAAHLAVPPEIWFEWREAQRNEYMQLKMVLLCFSTAHQLFKSKLPLTRKRLKLSLKLPLNLLSTEGLNAPYTPVTYRVDAQV